MRAAPRTQGAPRAAWAVCAAWLMGAALALPAHAGLFDDDEARKAILDLRARIEAASQVQQKALQAAVSESNAKHAEHAQQLQQLQNLQAQQAQQNQQLVQQNEILKRSLLDLNNQLELMRTEIAKMRGGDEQLARDVAELQRRQKDVQQGIDERLRKVEPQKVSVDGKEFLADPEEKRAFDEALATLRKGDFGPASTALQSFIRRYPGSGYTDSVHYWLGNAQYGKREYKEAVASFRQLVSNAPDHPRAAEALLALANCQVELKDTKGARKTLDELLKSYPQSEAAQAGRDRLAMLK